MCNKSGCNKWNKIIMNRVSLIMPALIWAMLQGCSRSPQSVEMRSLHAGRRYFDKKDYGRAILEFSNAVKAVPSDSDPHYRLGLARLAAGHVFAAAKEVQTTIE